jgi:hypothetical protein
MLLIKANDMSFASLNSSHHNNGWKIRVVTPKKPDFKAILTQKHFTNTLKTSKKSFYQLQIPKKMAQKLKSIRVSFGFLDLDLVFHAKLRFQTTIMKPLSSHGTSRHQENPF